VRMSFRMSNAAKRGRPSKRDAIGVDDEESGSDDPWVKMVKRELKRDAIANDNKETASDQETERHVKRVEAIARFLQEILPKQQTKKEKRPAMDHNSATNLVDRMEKKDRRHSWIFR
ncbi:hypothetical protein PENTCL1PPCAC_19, partial [Pristionchus entomophagus]